MNQAQIEAVAQANAFLNNVGLPPYVELFNYYGRLYRVRESFKEDDSHNFNEYMKANPDTGVLTVEGGRVIIVALSDRGVQA